MYGLDILVNKILMICLMVLVGFVLRKTGKADGKTAKACSDLAIYVAQPALIIYSFLDAKFSRDILITALFVLAFSTVFHFMFFGVASLLYKNSPEKRRVVLRFATIFTNAGFLGIPLISELISPEAAIYATFYVIAFNLMCWSLGCYMFTGDKSYISLKKMLINPATVPTYIGLILFIVSGLCTVPDALAPVWFDYIVPVMRDNLLFLLKSTMIPLSMIIIGIRLAENKIKDVFCDRYLPEYIIVRLILLPLAVMGIMKCVALTGIFPYGIVKPASVVLVISASTPAATMAGIFAEQFDGDAQYAGKIVSASTAVSLVTMPLIAALILKVF